MNLNALSASLDKILERYGQSFAVKTFHENVAEEDELMLVFGLTQAIKAKNKQYWGRESVKENYW